MTVDLAINRAAIDLCDQGRVWEESLDAMTLIGSIDAYELDLPAGAVLVCVRNVRLDARPLQLITSWTDFEGRAAQPGQPTHYAMRGNELVVYPAPHQSGGRVTLVATLKPAFNATSLPDVLLQTHMGTVAEGAKAYLKEMTGTAWFDPSGFALASQRFREGVSRARINVEHGFAAGSLSITPRRYGQR
jgi:hypothetical protein